ncbi:MAG: hypothetical protein EOM20_17055 [Spartobacteria bacterium]|nr:hypothetical protein [Spartobacteria bacterium]
MLANLVRQYEAIVKSWTITELDHAGPNIRLKARVEFTDDSTLAIRQVFLSPRTFKYAYHWQDQYENLICRWDNAPHWQNLSTFPYYKHTANDAPPVDDVSAGDLEAVFKYINMALTQ